jgi:hypothetical protein
VVARSTRQEITCDCTQRRGRKAAVAVLENEGTTKSHVANKKPKYPHHDGDNGSNEGILNATGHEISVNSAAGTLPDDGALGKS